MFLPERVSGGLKKHHKGTAYQMFVSVHKKELFLKPENLAVPGN